MSSTPSFIFTIELGDGSSVAVTKTTPCGQTRMHGYWARVTIDGRNLWLGVKSTPLRRIEQKERWVGFILEGGRSPAMFTQVIKGDFGDWLIDGQQRLFALHDFYVGKIGATFLDGTRMEAITDWTPTERRFYRRLSIPVAELSEDVSKREILQLYLSLNSAGTPHTTGELDTVRAQLADMENDDATANR